MSFSHGIIKDITLSSGVVLGYAHLVYYMDNDEQGTLTTALKLYISKAAALAGNTALDVQMTDQINTQFTYPTSAIDATNGHALGLLNHIVANEAVFAGGVVE